MAKKAIKAAEESSGDVSVTGYISAPEMAVATFPIIGTVPLVMNRFTKKAKEMMREKHEKGSQANKGKQKQPRDFDRDYQESMWKSDGWKGFPCHVLRNALVDACRLVGFKMTIAKLTVFVQADGFDDEDGTPLVRLYGEPQYREDPVFNANGSADIRVRAWWKPGWKANVKVKFDTAQFSASDVGNLLHRVGEQVGILDGRPSSPKSTGMGWGLFALENVEDKRK